eukprot:6212878-Pleurochrysis_carterae.AAC.1
MREIRVSGYLDVRSIMQLSGCGSKFRCGHAKQERRRALCADELMAVKHVSDGGCHRALHSLACFGEAHARIRESGRGQERGLEDRGRGRGSTRNRRKSKQVEEEERASGRGRGRARERRGRE